MKLFMPHFFKVNVMLTKILALDLGVTSCGYSVVEEIDDNYRLIDYGLVMRDNPYDGNTQKDRREHKQSRTLIDKKQARVRAIKELFQKHNIHFKEDSYSNLWDIRAVDVFKRILDGSEFFALCKYLAKHRGYKSLKVEDLIAEIEAKEKIGNCESGEVAIPDPEKFSETLAYLDALKCKHKEKTAAQIIYELESGKEETPIFRNHGDYRYMIRREDVEEELKRIVKAQEKFGFFENGEHAKNFLDELLEIIVKQDPVTLNEDLINNCLLYKEEKCAPVFSITFDKFNFYKMLNDLKIDKSPLSNEQRERLENDFTTKLKSGKNITSYSVKDIKIILGIADETVKINNFDEYKTVKGKKVKNVIVKFNFLAKLSEIDEAILERLLDENSTFSDELATILHRNMDPNKLVKDCRTLFKAYGIDYSKEQVQSLALRLYNKRGKGVSAYSFKALRELLCYMIEGKSESDIKEILGVGKAEDYSKFPKGVKYLKPIKIEKDGKSQKDGTLQYEIDENKISNHVVKSLVSWANRLIVDLHDKYGPFDIIKLESTRELSTPEKAKREIKSAQDKNQKEWEDLKKRYKKEAQANGIDLEKRSSYVLKLKLWEQQKQMGIYSLRPLGIDEILSDKTEIEHIVPRACGGSNAEYNKAVDLKDENAKKGNRLPLDYLDAQKQEQYKTFVSELFEERKINWKKYKNLTATSLDETFKEASDEISLHATSYAEKLLGEILKRYYPFTDKFPQNKKVMHISGRATSYLRRILSIDNKSRDTNFHHAEDAILIALMSESYLQIISKNFRQNYGKEKTEAKENFKKIVPLIDGASPNEVFAHLRKSYMEDIENNPFYKGLDGTLKTPAFWVSKKPIGTKAHNETIQSKKNLAYRVSVESLLDKVKPNYKTSIEKFVQDYDKEVYSKLQVVQDNPKDYTAIAFRKKRDAVVQALQEGLFITTKEEQQELNKKLLQLMREPIYDVNGNIIRRVKRVGEKATIEVRNGLAYTAPSLVCLRCGYQKENDKLKLERLDIRTYTMKRVAKSYEIDIFNNDLVEIFVFKKKQLHLQVTGILKGFTESGTRANLRNPKYPLLKEKQPKKYRAQFALGSACGIKKYKTDASGRVLGFYYLGRVVDNDKEFFAKVVSYRKI